MPYKSEALKVLRTIKKAGNGGELTLRVPAKSDPLSGITLGPPVLHKVFFVAVNYSREDLNDPSLANGLMKVLISPLGEDGNPIPDYLDIVENKNTSAILPDGTTFKVLHTKTTKPDGMYSIVTRAFLGG